MEKNSPNTEDSWIQSVREFEKKLRKFKKYKKWVFKPSS